MNVVAHNLIAMNTNRQLGIVGGNKAKSTEKLSSGYRINRAADDAAGLTISEKLRWQVKGLNKASVNCQDGASLVQVAEGALNEVHSILNRMKELSVQAANDTNTFTDRSHIQDEMNELVLEIDRISDTTMFNTMPLLKGDEKDVIDENTGRPVSIQDIPISDFSISDVSIGRVPFSAGSTNDTLSLNAILNGNYNISGTNWGLVYGNGSTSHSNFRYSYTEDGVKHSGSARINQMSQTDFSTNNNDEYKRTFSYSPETGVKFDIVQTVKVGQNDGTSQYYDVSYEVKNTGSRDVSFELLHNEDTAYNNNDSCEEYYLNGTKLDKFTHFTNNSGYLAAGNPNVKSNISDALDFSIYNAGNRRLPFSENIKVADNGALSSVLIGRYSSATYDWNNLDNFQTGLGESTNSRDKAFSIVWSADLDAGGSISGLGFKQGIIAAESDDNVKDVPITDTPASKIHVSKKELWIQSGALDKSGFFINVEEMNSNVLGISNIDVHTHMSASAGLERIDKAIDKLSLQRADLGAQQNRLEKAIQVDDSTSENTDAAESRIRDTDMAREMVTHSAASIIEQAGQAMLAQANQSTQGVLSLLQ